MSTIKSQQILVPKKVHIGDTAELQCTFSFDSLKLKNLVSKGKTELPLSIFNDPIDENECEISKITLSPAGINYYQLGITFTTWKTGTIEFPDITIEDLELTLDPENIVSLTEQYKTSTIQESAAPLLLPGTTYKLYSSILVCVLVIIITIIIVLKRKNLSFFIKNTSLRIRYFRNKKKAIKKLRYIGNNTNIKDTESAGQIQNIMRLYLENRYDYPFTRAVTSDLMPTFNRITQNLLSDKKYEAFEEISDAFVRTDYIRYSKNALFLVNEKKSLVEKLVKDIEILEGVEDA